MNLCSKACNKLIALAMLVSCWSGSMAVQAGDVAAGEAKSAVCAACHGAKGKAQIPIYPHLAGQNAAYLVQALQAYKNKQRIGGQAVIMQGQAASLSEEDMENLAAYYASLEP